MNIKDIDTSTQEFQDALRLVQFTHNSLFLTGKAGTGKSTFLKYICATTKKKFVVLAPTGIAAINAGGSTLHSFFKLPFYPLLPDDPKFSSPGRLRDFLRYNKSQLKTIQKTELIIIDEISMVRADIIDFIDRILRIYTHNLRVPFGGKQLLLVGDIFQLEPVVKSDERAILEKFYPTPYFFSANVFNEMSLVSIELTKVYRQKDPAFIGILNHIRNNTMLPADLQLLNTRVSTTGTNDIKEDELRITLATRRDTVDFINRKHLEAINEVPFILRGEIKGEFSENSLPTLMDLTLKPEAQIIFVKNDRNRQWVNGTIGTVIDYDRDAEHLHIQTDEGKNVTVERAEWSNVRYTYNEEEKKIEEEELGVFIQFPVKLAWAITIHKSQGLTFKNVTIDFTGGVFAGGQAYVALSRCTSLEGIRLKCPVQRRDIFVRPEIIRFSKEFNDKNSIDQALKLAQADIRYKEAVTAFDKGDFEHFLETFFKAIHLRYEIEKPLVRRFIRKKLNVINDLRTENILLKEKLLEQRRKMKKYAREYLEMGHVCINEANDLKAAIRNYDKAIEMDPLMTDAYIYKGMALTESGRLRDALTILNKAVRLSPTSFMAVYGRGKNFLQMQKYEEAAADFDKATTLKPLHVKAHKLFGDALDNCGNEEGAAIQWALAEKLMKRKRRKEK